MSDRRILLVQDGERGMSEPVTLAALRLTAAPAEVRCLLNLHKYDDERLDRQRFDQRQTEQKREPDGRSGAWIPRQAFTCGRDCAALRQTANR